MKKKMLLFSMILTAAVLTSGCGKGPEAPVTYSNLTEDSIRYDLDSLLTTAGVPDAQRAQFFTHVDQINAVMRPGQLTDGFTEIGPPKYDPYDLQDAWSEAHPDFLGYDCRITSFSLFADPFLTVPEPEITPNTEMLEFDLDSISRDPSAFPGRQRQFLSFFSPVPTEATKNVKIHAEKVLAAWADRGISFTDSDQIRMINMFFHVEDGEKNFLYAGHSGILLPTPDGELWFLEKLAFEEPYQVVRFENRKQLRDYLMDKYDVDQNQPTAKPFILENDGLLEP